MLSFNVKKDHLDFIDEVRTLTFGWNFDELINYTNFSFCEFKSHGDILQLLLKSNNKKIIKYVLNNISSIYAVSGDGTSIIHCLSAYLKNKEMLDYFVKKYHFDLELLTIKGSRPIHCACYHNSLEIIDYFVNNKGCDLNSTNWGGLKPIEILIMRQPYDTIKYFFAKFLDETIIDNNIDNNIKHSIIERTDINTAQKIELLEMINRNEKKLK